MLSVPLQSTFCPQFFFLLDTLTCSSGNLRPRTEGSLQQRKPRAWAWATKPCGCCPIQGQDVHDSAGADGCGGKGNFRNQSPSPASPSLPLGPSAVPQSSRWGQVSLLADLSVYGALNWIGYLGYHIVLSRALYFAVPIANLCHSAPWLPCFLLTVCIRVSEYFLSSRCIILCDMVSPSYYNFL